MRSFTLKRFLLGPLVQSLNMFYLFADDTNVLHSHKDLKSLEKEMNVELNNVY